jgi:hypothetical protein
MAKADITQLCLICKSLPKMEEKKEKKKVSKRFSFLFPPKLKDLKLLSPHQRQRRKRFA